MDDQPIVIDNKFVVISEHRRWLALNYLAVTDKKWEKTKCRIMHFESERERALKIIEFNPHNGKSTSRLYNEITMLHGIYDPEALEASLSNLRQYTDVPKLECRRITSEAIKRGLLDPQRIDHSLSEEEQWNQALPFVSELLKEKNDKKVDKSVGRTRDLIAKQLGLGKTNCDKISEIGKMAEEGDKIAIDAMKNLDAKKWTIGSAYNVIRIRKLQNSGKKGHVDASGYIEKITKGETKTADAGKFIKAVVSGIKATDGETYDVLLLKPEGNPDKFKIRPLPLHKKTIILWLTPANYLKNSIELLRRWLFTYLNCIPVHSGADENNPWLRQRYDFLLVNSINNYIPTDIAKFSEMIQSTDIYDVIDKAFPEKTKYDVSSHVKFGTSRDSEKAKTPPTPLSPANDGDW